MTFNERLEALRQNAIRKRLWEKTYAVSNKRILLPSAYSLSLTVTAIPNLQTEFITGVNRRTKLKTYDPDMYRLLQEYFYEIEIPIHNVVHE